MGAFTVFLFSNKNLLHLVIVLAICLKFCVECEARKWNLDHYQHRQRHRSKTGSGDMFISLYEHENFRGEVYRQTIARKCSNIPKEYDNWASSVVLHDHCVTICEARDCTGGCKNFYPNEKGMGRLSRLGLNDNISSVKYCYRFR